MTHVNFSSWGLGRYLRTTVPNNSKQFVVLGLGRFGRGVCGTLHHLGYEVLGVDTETQRVASAIGDRLVAHAVQLDVTDHAALEEAGVFEFDTAIVAIGNYIEPSIVATLTLKEAGIRQVVAKASSDIHVKLLEKVGADRVIFPEHEMGCELARMLTRPSILERLELDPENSIVEVLVPQSFDGKTLQELALRQRYGVSVLAISRAPQDHGQPLAFAVNPSPQERLKAGMVLVAIGQNEAIERLPI